MAMFLTLLCMGMLVFAASCICFQRAIRQDETRPEPTPEKRLGTESRFFAGDIAAVPAAGLPRDVLLMQLERHVRLEQAAAEIFLDRPTQETLHSPSASQLAN